MERAWDAQPPPLLVWACRPHLSNWYWLALERTQKTCTHQMHQMQIYHHPLLGSLCLVVATRWKLHCSRAGTRLQEDSCNVFRGLTGSADLLRIGQQGNGELSKLSSWCQLQAQPKNG